MKKKDTIGIIGLGYVGLPLARLFATKYAVVGFDVNQTRIRELRQGEDTTQEVSKALLESVYLSENTNEVGLFYSSESQDLKDCTHFIVTVPTPVDKNNRPVLTPLIKASETVGGVMKKGAIVVYESTVYPGATEEDCVPVLENVSGLKFNEDFFVGYSPERINPGDKNHTVEKIKKVTSGSNVESAINIDNLYKSVIIAGTHLAPSIKVAEAAKVIENTQRDLNIALVNELKVIYEKMGIDVWEVIEACSTKPFGFMPFFPSIGVGGHCIPVDPTYLSYISEKFGMEAKFINLANAVNSNRPKKIALRIKEELCGSLLNKRIQIAGIAYTPDVSDLRESPALQLIDELIDAGAKVSWFDPLVQNYNNQNSEPLNPNIDIGLIVTPHSQIDFSIWKEANVKVLDLSANSINYGWPKFL